ncbi:GAF and ANTAR domain-containing protein [Paractinoplanes deccanensis]|uniref:GAF and ANTAR domain-containing protein n=1 Tax=Paractinoplanes deccanensis TaxID=113561 RepID=UPI00194287E8|nr:GAF and ANTAR domain-containing protein [Actinoplanes deccanensis]
MSGQTPQRGELAGAMAGLAGTPDDSPSVDGRLAAIARLAAGRVRAAEYASITALRGAAYTSVVVSDELIQAVDDAQYRDEAGPCVEALRDGAPVAVPDVGAIVRWPGFHEEAAQLGLHASVSVPLFAGRGEAVAVLNVYGRDHVAMAPLIAGILVVHGGLGRDDVDEAQLTELDAGGEELVAGYAAALDVRATIKLAVRLIGAARECGPDEAYLVLCARAEEAGTDLADVAADLVKNGL